MAPTQTSQHHQSGREMAATELNIRDRLTTTELCPRVAEIGRQKFSWRQVVLQSQFSKEGLVMRLM